MNNNMDSILEKAEEHHCDSKLSSLTIASSRAFSKHKNSVMAGQNSTDKMSEEVKDSKGSQVENGTNEL